MVLAHLVNRSLPARFYLSQSEMLQTVLRLEQATKRELLAQAFQDWKTIGRLRPRGYRLPKLSAIRQRI